MGKYIVELKKNETLYKATTRESDGTAYVCSAIGTSYTEPDLEQVRKEAYEQGQEDLRKSCVPKDEEAYGFGYNEGFQCGLDLAWEAARKIVLDEWDNGIKYDDFYELFNGKSCKEVLKTYNVSEVIEEIRAHEQAQKEKEEQEEKDSVTAEDAMRQYLDTFCSKCKGCGACILHTPDFTCGRGYHFLTENRISDEEVRRAYAKVMKEK